jgi:phosphate/sulfate permease
MTTNVGTTDRIIRLVIALIAAIVAFSVGPSTVLGIVMFVVALIMIVTAAVRFCPIWRLFGVNTCSR